VASVDFNVPPDVPRRKQPDIKSFLHDIGEMPLPVYIKRDTVKSDSGHYQTVYAEKDGAVAAPTAGLHFTDRLIHSIKDKGIDIRKITLHVGYGTFKPVTVKDFREHTMDEESYEIPVSTAAAINAAKAEGRRIIAVGTTVTRALETAASGASSRVVPGKGRAALFIYPGYQFHVVDALVTNFHLPKSTPMMLASAFSGLAVLKKAYSVAQSEGYRFYSYGDAMMMR
jgi:S-adenosylmethionine:tRNA ribosyltransferase-isomerase